MALQLLLDAALGPWECWTGLLASGSDFTVSGNRMETRLLDATSATALRYGRANGGRCKIGEIMRFQTMRHFVSHCRRRIS